MLSLTSLTVMFTKIVVALLVVFLGYAYHVTQAPPPEVCGSPNGPPVTGPRIKLSDGRHLAYIERGVAKEVSNFRVITIHGISSCKYLLLPASQKLIEELGIYILSYDRAGYGESDPNPKRSTVKSEVFDLQELVDQLEIGEKFYVIGISMGACPIWGCLKYIPHRLAGAALVVPVVNYWWPSLPSALVKKVYRQQPFRDQLALIVAHYVPQLYSWISRRWFSTLKAVQIHKEAFSPQDMVIISKMLETITPNQGKAMQQGVFESLHRDLLVGFGNWEFDPLDLNNPFQQNESSVHIWQGYHDRMVPVLLQRFVSERLPWIKYHEVPNAGHLLPFDDNLFDAVLKSLLIGDEPDIM